MSSVVEVDGLAVVGVGPVATVHALPSSTPAAIKVFPGPLDRFTRVAFDREQAALGALSGVSSILRVDAVLQAPGGRPGLRMELCAQSLGQLLDAHGPLSLPDALAVGQAVATALAAAHEAGVVHGAVTPHNVLLRANGEPVLADFGVALRRRFPRRPDAWAAPETVRHNEMSERTDLYGLGAVLHAALARGTIPEPVRALLSHLLAEDPADRPADAASVLADLVAAAADETDTAPGEFDDFPHNPDRESARQVGDRFFAEWENGAPDPPAPPTRSRSGRVVGVAAALGVLLAVPVLVERQPAPAFGSVAHSEPAGTPAFTVPTPAIELDDPVEEDNAVQLTWRGGTDLDFAVVVAGASVPTRIVMVHHQRTLRVPVDPGRQYCFLVQGTDGEHVYQTAPRPIRGAVCKL